MSAFEYFLFDIEKIILTILTFKDVEFRCRKLMRLIPKPNVLDSQFSISNGFVSSKIYDKWDDFDFDMVNFPFLDGGIPRSTA